MAQTFTNLLTHIIFSSKDRTPSIGQEFRADLHAYMGGIIRNLAGQALLVNGTADHVHLLVWLPPIVAIAEALRVLKSNSSKWIHETFPAQNAFAWQAGYGAFSVSQSNVAAVLKYIRDQERHHRRKSFQEEFLAFLKRNNIAYDERYIWR
jgi:REP element-mobilizing transposase RayT